MGYTSFFRKNQGTEYGIAEAEAELFELENRCMAMKEKQCLVEERKKYFETELTNAIKAERSVE